MDIGTGAKGNDPIGTCTGSNNKIGYVTGRNSPRCRLSALEDGSVNVDGATNSGQD